MTVQSSFFQSRRTPQSNCMKYGKLQVALKSFVCIALVSVLVDVCFPYAIENSGFLPKGVLVRCLVDSFSHGVISVVVWEQTLNRGFFASRYSLCHSYLCSVLLDVDHFIAAGSLTLKAATRCAGLPSTLQSFPESNPHLQSSFSAFI